ncbi:MAG TPA: magnesium transporter [Pseudogracilibacillus sp.]|nr:magnesium transporter [Pseudogracilibacillus sp.]
MVKLEQETKEQYTKKVLDAIESDNIADFRETFLELHPQDRVDMFLEFTESLRKRCYTYLSAKEFAMIFPGFTLEKQLEFLDELDETYATAMFNNMFTDDVVYFLNGLNEQQAEHILTNMNEEQAEKVRTLLAYEDETAGAIMTKELIRISANKRAEDVITQLRAEAPSAEIIYYNYVVDEDGLLVGVVSLRDLITAPPEDQIKEIMSTRVVSVDEQMDQEDVANVIQKYDILAVPVVSKENRLLGIVTVDDVIDIMEDETTEDFGEISAAKGATDINISSFEAAKKRSPWIIALMFFGLITASVIGQFEETLEQVVILAAFVPMIMDSAGNVGTQSLTVSVRGLALGTVGQGSFSKMIRREFRTGLMMGIICMFIIAIIIPIFYGTWMIGAIVGISILCTLSVSSVVGAVVPLIIHKLKIDPAVASGPFITTINDIIGLLIYFSIATALLDVL